MGEKSPPVKKNSARNTPPAVILAQARIQENMNSAFPTPLGQVLKGDKRGAVLDPYSHAYLSGFLGSGRIFAATDMRFAAFPIRFNL